MSTSFEIVCKLKEMKRTDTFTPFEVKDFPSKWQITKLRFNMISGNNQFVGEISGGKWTDDSKNKILTKSKGTKDTKSENITIEWAKRKDPESIAKVAGWKIYTVDLLSKEERQRIEKEGTEEEKAIAAKKISHFLEKTEMAQLVNKIIASGKYNDAKFKITGTVDFQYSPDKQIYYRTLSVNKIYRVADDTPTKAEMNLNAFYTADSIDSDSYDEKKKYFFNCYTDYYFSNIKKTRFVPMTLVIDANGDEKAEKTAKRLVEKKINVFDEDSEVRKIGLVCTMINGAQEKAITYDDLDEETKEDIECELITLEDAIRSLGGSAYGDKVTETRVKSIAKAGANSSEATVYTLADLKKAPVPEDAPETEEDIDLFDDEEDDDDIII